MKRMIISLALVMALLLSSVASAGLLPKANTLYGEFMPSPEFAVNRAPISDVTENDVRTLTFEPFSDSDYVAFSKYLGAWGCECAGASSDANLITVEVKKGDLLVSFTYNRTEQSAAMVYPKGTRPETEYSGSGKEKDILPSLKMTFGVCMPSFCAVLDRDPVSDIIDENGNKIMTFDNVTEKDFEAFGRYAASLGCTLDSWEKDGSKALCTIAKNGSRMLLVFDNVEYSATVSYPVSVFTDNTARAKQLNTNESILPSADEVFGKTLPTLTIALGRAADEQSTAANGTMTQTFYNFVEDDYNKFSTYLLNEGCSVLGYSVEGQKVEIQLSLNDTAFVFTYDREQKCAVVKYESGTRPQATATPKPTPKPTATPKAVATATPKATKKSRNYSVDQCYNIAANYLKNNLKNPGSLQIHGYTYSVTDDNEYCIIIDYSAQNGFGGYNRAKYYVWVNYYTGQVDLAWSNE